MFRYKLYNNYCICVQWKPGRSRVTLLVNYKKKEKLSWKIALPPDESLTSKDGTVLICIHCIADTTSCVHEHISPLLGEHLCIVNVCLGPVTVHYRQVSL